MLVFIKPGISDLPTPFEKMKADIFDGVATSAQYADLAEKFQADHNYQPGTVLMFGGPKSC
jgi:hypothetical protein